MAYLRSLVLISILGLLALSLDALAPREANLATAYYSSGGGGGAGGSAHTGPLYMNMNVVGGGNMQGASILQSGWSRSYVRVPLLQKQASPDIQSQSASSQPPVSQVIDSSSSSIHIDASSPIVPDAPISTPSSGIAEFLLRSLSGTDQGDKAASPFFSDPANPVARLLELAGLSEETNPTRTNLTPAAPSPSAAFIPDPYTPRVSTAPSSAIVPIVRTTGADIPLSQGPTAPETTFASDESGMGEREYIHEVTGRMQQRRFVSQADYGIALVVAKDNLEEARALLDTRNSFQKFMDWIGIGSTLMVAYKEAEADLTALTHAAGLAGLGR